MPGHDVRSGLGFLLTNRGVPAMLTDAAARNAKPKEKLYRVGDSRGLCLEVTPAGGKHWRLRYRFEDKAKMLGLGTYPDVSLSVARQRRDEARALLERNIDPSAHRKEQAARARKERERAAATFEAVAREWWREKHAREVKERTAADNLRRLENYAFPSIGGLLVPEIDAPVLVRLLQPIANMPPGKRTAGGPEVARRLRMLLGQVFRYAMLTGRAKHDPTPALRHGALPTAKGGHYAAAVDATTVGELLRAIDAYDGTPVVCAALRLMPLLAVRPGELQHMRWEDVDLDTAEWRFTIGKTKTEHIVPLARQAVAMLEDLRPLTGHGRYVFPSMRVADGSRPMSNVAMLAALRRMGIPKEEATVHGWRATFRTLADEGLGEPEKFIEHQLGHKVRDPLGRAYNRTKHLPERRRMMQRWADYLETLRGRDERVCSPRSGG